MTSTNRSTLLRNKILQKTKHVVVKIGSSVLVDSKGNLSYKALLGVAKDIARIQKRGIHVTLVSSGAVASGMQYLGFEKKPSKMSQLQACAAIGQPLLMHMYQKALSSEQLQAAQVLLTRDDIAHKKRFLNARDTFHELLRHGVIPIVNENDTVVVDEIRVGDNDNLSALVSAMIQADLLILLTDQDGFYTADPRKNPKAEKIDLITQIDKNTFSKAAGTDNKGSVGGMKTKLEAAQTAARHGVSTIIAHGQRKNILQEIFSGKNVGSLFLVKKKK
ncbi:MAG: glutamate 5-kinase [Deltaproteobacteria bacterium]|nr:MAG: glutamate 5-kinase [Deltaproteobacteria bacterium]